jgi:probable rRNA maturation factor
MNERHGSVPDGEPDAMEPSRIPTGATTSTGVVSPLAAGAVAPIGDGVEIFLADEQSDVEVDPMRWGQLARAVLEVELPPTMLSSSQVSVMFVDELTIADLNARFLDGEGPTDVLAFPIDDDLVERGRQPDQGGRGPGGPSASPDIPVMLGDVLVCPSVALRQAQERSVSLDEELALLVVHGVLHLIKFDHEDEAERLAMEERQRFHLERWRARDAAASAPSPMHESTPVRGEASSDTAGLPEPGRTGPGDAGPGDAASGDAASGDTAPGDAGPGWAEPETS